MTLPAVVLVRPQVAGNIGAAARAMANTGLDDLRLVEPAAEIDNEAYSFAMHAHAILRGARRFDSLADAERADEVGRNRITVGGRQRAIEDDLGEQAGFNGGGSEQFGLRCGHTDRIRRVALGRNVGCYACPASTFLRSTLFQ